MKHACIIRCRSREGAWIEIPCICHEISKQGIVAPVRERGLKSCPHMRHNKVAPVAPVRERGLKSPRAPWSVVLLPSRSREGAWIEMVHMSCDACATAGVAPVRERGLKSHVYNKGNYNHASLP